MKCDKCGDESRMLWGPGQFPRLTDIESGNWIALQECPDCHALWVSLPYEPYASFIFLARWLYSRSAWNRVQMVDDGRTLAAWHQAMIREHWQDLPADERLHVDHYHQRSCGHNPIDQSPSFMPPVRIARAKDMGTLVKNLKEEE